MHNYNAQGLDGTLQMQDAIWLEVILDLRLKNPDGHFLNDESDQRGLCQLCGTWTTYAPARPVLNGATCNMGGKECYQIWQVNSQT